MSNKKAITAILIVYVVITVLGIIGHCWTKCWGWHLLRSELPVSDIQYFGGDNVHFKVMDGDEDRWVKVPLDHVGHRYEPSSTYTSVEFVGLSMMGFDADEAYIVLGKEDVRSWQAKIQEWREKRDREIRERHAPRRVLPDGR